MEVECATKLGQTGRFFLKLFDPRYATQLREDENAKPWDLAQETAYQDFVESGEDLKCVNHLRVRREQVLPDRSKTQSEGSEAIEDEVSQHSLYEPGYFLRPGLCQYLTATRLGTLLGGRHFILYAIIVASPSSRLDSGVFESPLERPVPPKTPGLISPPPPPRSVTTKRHDEASRRRYDRPGRQEGSRQYRRSFDCGQGQDFLRVKASAKAPIGKGKKRAREDDDEDDAPPPAHDNRARKKQLDSADTTPRLCWRRHGLDPTSTVVLGFGYRFKLLPTDLQHEVMSEPSASAWPGMQHGAYFHQQRRI
ncbi:hypothetical protein MMC07_008693 [Pseudocyphellaria aurata]|nr:hypothetical protein [Pseudocyphellaria aurata]